jgi:hypothetical protein
MGGLKKRVIGQVGSGPDRPPYDQVGWISAGLLLTSQLIEADVTVPPAHDDEPTLTTIPQA